MNDKFIQVKQILQDNTSATISGYESLPTNNGNLIDSSKKKKKKKILKLYKDY
jgi:hypothetical protein